jgi:predicted dienelactone hydrolase
VSRTDVRARDKPPRRRPTPGTVRRRRLTALALALLVAGVAVAIATGGGSRRGGRDHDTAGLRSAPAGTSRSTPSGSSGIAPHRAGSGSTAQTTARAYSVGVTSLPLREPATAATATGHAPSGAPIRVLPTIVRYPATGRPGPGAHPGAAPAAGPFPLVVFSQGFDISAEAYAWLLDAWARAGYVVADPTYPLTDPSTPEGVNEQDIVNHPADLRFVISALLAAGHDRNSVLHGLVDPARVGIVGHSDGGDVSLAVAANSCCRDPAVKAAVILSGAELSAFGGSYYSGGSTPILVVQGSADTVNVPGCSAQLYGQAPPPKYYVNIAGAEHEPPYLESGPVRTGIARTVADFFDAFLSHRPARLHALVRRGTVTAGETITTAALPAGTSTYCPGAP